MDLGMGMLKKMTNCWPSWGQFSSAWHLNASPPLETSNMWPSDVVLLSLEFSAYRTATRYRNLGALRRFIVLFMTSTPGILKSVQKNRHIESPTLRRLSEKQFLPVVNQSMRNPSDFRGISRCFYAIISTLSLCYWVLCVN